MTESMSRRWPRTSEPAGMTRMRRYRGSSGYLHAASEKSLCWRRGRLLPLPRDLAFLLILAEDRRSQGFALFRCWLLRARQHLAGERGGFWGRLLLGHAGYFVGRFAISLVEKRRRVINHRGPTRTGFMTIESRRAATRVREIPNEPGDIRAAWAVNFQWLEPASSDDFRPMSSSRSENQTNPRSDVISAA